MSLVSRTEVKSFLGVTVTTDDTLLDALLAAATALFEAACGRERAPFGVALPGRVEVRDGTGTDTLWLDYRPSAITSVVLGRNPASPDETLDPTDADVLSWTVGDARLVRVDGGAFGRMGAPRVVRVTYDAQTDQPDDAKLAVERAIAVVYRQLGSEDVKQEQAGSYQAQLAAVIIDDPIWAAAVGAHLRREF